MSLLNQHEVNSPVWQKLVAYYEPLLATHRARLENPKIAESERIALCWKIDSIKELLALAKQPESKK